MKKEADAAKEKKCVTKNPDYSDCLNVWPVEFRRRILGRPPRILDGRIPGPTSLFFGHDPAHKRTMRLQFGIDPAFGILVEREALKKFPESKPWFASPGSLRQTFPRLQCTIPNFGPDFSEIPGHGFIRVRKPLALKSPVPFRTPARKPRHLDCFGECVSEFHESRALRGHSSHSLPTGQDWRRLEMRGWEIILRFRSGPGDMASRDETPISTGTCIARHLDTVLPHCFTSLDSRIRR